MALIQLYHPEHGLVAQKQEVARRGKHHIITAWKHRYGKKFYECHVHVEKPPKKTYQRRIVNLITGDIYWSIYQAATELSIDKKTIKNHLERRLVRHERYLVKWEY